MVISFVDPSKRSFAQQRNDLVLVGDCISNSYLWVAFSISEIVKRRYPSGANVKNFILLYFFSLKISKLLFNVFSWRIVDYRLSIEHLLILPLFFDLIFEEIIPFRRDILAIAASSDQYLIHALLFLSRVGGLSDLNYISSYLLSVNTVGVGAFACDAFKIEGVLGFSKQERVFEV